MHTVFIDKSLFQLNRYDIVEKRRMKGDTDGVVELPFKLVIASIIIIITVSVAFGGLERYSESIMRDRAEAAVDSVRAAAAEVSSMGVNSSVKAKVDLSSSPFHRIDTFTIGCGPDDDSHKCRGVEYKVAGFSSEWRVVKDGAGHDVALRGKERKVVLGEGEHNVLLIKAVDHVEVVKL